MTFYNIIFGILFFGAIRQVFGSLASPGGPDLLAFWEASTLTLLIFSDVVYTSHVLEELKCRYTVWMKLLDLASFLLLTVALLVLNPTASNFLQLSLEPAFAEIPHATSSPLSFWVLVLAYWILLVTWVRVAEIHPSRADFDRLITRPLIRTLLWFLIRWGRLIGLLILGCTAMSAAWKPGWLTLIAPLVFSLTLLYLLLNGVILSRYPVKAPLQQA